MNGSGALTQRAGQDDLRLSRQTQRQQIKEALLQNCALRLEALLPAADSPWPELRLSDWEDRVRNLSQHFAREALEQLILHHPGAQPDAVSSCPGCQKSFRIQERQQGRTLPTSLGDIGYRRPYGTCDRCHISGAPLDWALGIPPSGPSIAYRQQVSDACTLSRSFELGKRILQNHDRLHLGTKAAWRLTLQEGRRLVEHRQQQVQVVFQDGVRASPPPTPASAATGPHPRNLPDEQALPVPLLVVTCDGGRVQTLAEAKADRWKEDRIGAVYNALPRPQPHAQRGEYEGAKALTTTFVATMENWETFGPMLYTEALHRGYDRARQKIFLADGAPSIRELQQHHFPEAVFILDWCHAAEHLHNDAKAIFGSDTAQAHPWAERQIDRLWQGKTSAIIAELQIHSRRLGFPRSADPDTASHVVLYRDAFSYFPNNQKAMRYPLFRAHGWPIGSGAAESAVKRFGLRVKGSEKFWRIRGAEEMLALLASNFSEDGRWQRYWQRRADPYLPLKPPPQANAPPLSP
jgi:hypothetical protein